MISPMRLRNEARFQCYVYFDKNIRALPKNKNGEFIEDNTFVDSDIDAFRHACVSGIFTMRFGNRPALIFGWLQEFFFPSGGPAGKAMDIWNNRKGRDAAKGLKSENSLFKKIDKMLQQDELATSPNDPRLFGAELEINPIPHTGRFIRLGAPASGTDLTYFELSTQTQYTRKQLVSFIQAGKVPEYCLRKLGKRWYPVAKPDASSENNLS